MNMFEKSVFEKCIIGKMSIKVTFIICNIWFLINIIIELKIFKSKTKPKRANTYRLYNTYVVK